MALSSPLSLSQHSMRCLFKCVTKVSSWYVAMFAAVDREPALPHCVTALAGADPITTFKLHNTVDSHGSHCGIVCFHLHKMKNLFWFFLCSSPFHLKKKYLPAWKYCHVAISCTCTRSRHQAPGTRQPPQCLGSSHSWVLVTNQTLLVAIGSVGCQPSQGWETIDAFIYVLWIQQHFWVPFQVTFFQF